MCRNGASCGCKGSGGFPVGLAVCVIAAAAILVFVAAYATVVALAAAAFAVIMVSFAVWTRKFRRLPQPPAVATRRARPGRSLSAPPKAIEAPRAVTGQVVTPAAVPVRQARP